MRYSKIDERNSRAPRGVLVLKKRREKRRKNERERRKKGEIPSVASFIPLGSGGARRAPPHALPRVQQPIVNRATSHPVLVPMTSAMGIFSS